MNTHGSADAKRLREVRRIAEVLRDRARGARRRSDGKGRRHGGRQTERLGRGRRLRQRQHGWVDGQCSGEPLLERARQFGLAGHHAPELLARGARMPREMLLRDSSLDAQELEPLAERGELRSTFGNRRIEQDFR